LPAGQIELKEDQINNLRGGQYITGSTDLAAALMACGVTPSKDSPCTNTYTDDRPYRTGVPGKVLYHLERSSSTFTNNDGSPIPADKLAGGFESIDANEKLDVLIEEIDDELLRRKIQAQLPLAIMSHHRAALGNRQIIRKWWRKVTPYFYVKKGKKRFLIAKDAKKTAKKWNA
tara:strand:- start:2460 stop:2981 length:522 start_codon:yes stop_codon:yes gene_type:complete